MIRTFSRHIPVVFMLAALGALLFPLVTSAQKNDTVYMLNGDRISGEFKKYENGLLKLSTNGLGTIYIEWDKIKTFYSGKYFEVVKTTGFSYFGSVMNSKTPGCIDVVISNDTLTEQITSIVEITKINLRFWKKFSGSVDLGISYYKSTKTLQYYFDGVLNYRARKDLFTLAVDYFYSEQRLTDSTAISRKTDVGLSYTHFFQGRFWLGIGAKVQQNTELQLASRFLASAGAGVDVVRTNPIRLFFMAGALVNREKPEDSVSASNNFEGLLAGKFTWLQYRHPKISISTDFSFYPSFTVAGRYRLEYNLSAKYEIFKDFFLGLTFYDDYDSKPSGGGPALNDWSTVLTIGYTF